MLNARDWPGWMQAMCSSVLVCLCLVGYIYAYAAKLDKMDDDLYGSRDDGVPGLVSRVSSIEETLESINVTLGRIETNLDAQEKFMVAEFKHIDTALADLTHRIERMEDRLERVANRLYEK